MDINKVMSVIKNGSRSGFDVYERRQGKYQLIVPILHEDGDMVDIYLQDSVHGDNYVRICDFGMSLMRISCTFEINSVTRQQIFNSILINNGIEVSEGNLYLDTRLEMLYESILQFAGCVQKICSMHYWSKARIHTAFYEDLKDYTTTKLEQFDPLPDKCPLENYQIISVDWSLTHNNRNLYLFGVASDNKAKNVAISLLEFQKAKLPFISLIVHEDMEKLGRKEKLYLTKNADTQYPTLADFQEKGPSDIERLAA